MTEEFWLNLVEGKPIKETCQPCKKIKIRKGQSAIRLDEFMNMLNFITWSGGRFVGDAAAIIAKQDSFKIYEDQLTPAQTALNDYWHTCRYIKQSF